MNRKQRIFSMDLCIIIFMLNILIVMGAGEGIDKEFHVKSGETKLYIKVRGRI